MDVEGWWEDQIEIEDSDLPSLLSIPNPPSLLPCSHPTKPPPPFRRLIPGPAGSVQAMIHRHITASRPRKSPHVGGGVASQLPWDDDNGGGGDEFKTNPWLSALSSIGPDSVPYPISSIKDDRGLRRVKQVVGMVSSCRPNGFGDLVVTLKDPTGSIGAFVHHKVLADSRFGNGDIAVGCVLVLKQVVAFPIRLMVYLNITANNVIEIINKDCGPPQEPTMPTIAAGSRDSGKWLKVNEVAEDIMDHRTGEHEVVDRDLRRVVFDKVITKDKFFPVREATKQSSFKETTMKANSKGIPNTTFGEGSIMSSPFSKERLSSMHHRSGTTPGLPLAVPGVKENLDRLPTNFSSPSAGTISDNHTSKSGFSEGARATNTHKQIPDKDRIHGNFLSTKTDRISDNPLQKLTSIRHVTPNDEQSLHGYSANTIFRGTDTDRLPVDPHIKMASSLRASSAITLGLSKALTPSQSMGTCSTGEASQSTVNGQNYPTASMRCGIEKSSPTSKECAQPAVKVTEPMGLIPKPSATEWTDEQLEELFADYQDGEDMFKLEF